MGLSCGARNFLPLLLSLILLSVSPLSSSFSPSDKVTVQLLKQICSEPSIHRHFCLERLRSNPRTFTVDLHGLLGLIIESAESIGQRNRAMMINLAKTTSDSKLKAGYESCTDIYNYAMREIKRAKGSLGGRAESNYRQIWKNMADAFGDAGSCEDAFDGPSKEPPFVLRRNEVFERFCNIARVISQLVR